MSNPNGIVRKHLYSYRIEVPWGIILTDDGEYCCHRLREMWPKIKIVMTGGKLFNTTEETGGT